MSQNHNRVLKIIIVDDDEQNLYLLEVMLKNEKFDVTCACNGNEALQLLKKNKYDLIITDILMPVLDGFQLCRECKTDPVLKNIPFIFYTATYINDSDKDFALKLGADRFIIKPADPTEFMKIIKEVICQYTNRDINIKESQIDDENLYLTEYNKRLVEKLGSKILMLEKVNLELIKQKDMTRNYLDIAGVIILILDKKGNIKLINKKGCEIIGQNEEELIDENWFDNFVPEEYREAMIEAHKANISNKKFYEYLENAVLSKDNKTRIIAWHNSLIKDVNNGIYGVLCSGEDITERKQAEEKIKQSLFERETLIRELYHRTKNTMLVIRGMLVLQAEEYPMNLELQRVIKSTEDRIQAISLVHEMLYKSQDLSHISIKEYINELSFLILQSFGISTDRITLNIKIDNQYFLLDTAIPFGLILNELMTNSLKYAFPDNKKGIISITLFNGELNKSILYYSDNGAGVPAEFNFRKQNTLGLRLIYSIGEQQMMGSVTMENKNGVCCKLEFSNDLYKSRV